MVSRFDRTFDWRRASPRRSESARRVSLLAARSVLIALGATRQAASAGRLRGPPRCRPVIVHPREPARPRRGAARADQGENLELAAAELASDPAVIGRIGQIIVELRDGGPGNGNRAGFCGMDPAVPPSRRKNARWGANGTGYRAAIYHRVSTVDQNPNAARRDLRDAARRMGLRIALDLRETGRGTNNNRPGLVRVIQAARRGLIDVVLVWKLDRFGSSAFDLLANIRQLEAAGARFVSVTQGIDIRPGRDSMSRQLLTMLAAVAEFERDVIVERTRLGIENARRAGKRIGRPPHPKPPRERVQQLRKRGVTWDQIAKRLRCTVWEARAAEKTGGAKQREEPRRRLPSSLRRR